MSWEAFPLVLFAEVWLENKTHEYTNSRNVWFGGLNQYDVKEITKVQQPAHDYNTLHSLLH